MTSSRRFSALVAACVLAGATACTGTGGDTVARMTPNPSNTFEAESRDDALPPRFPRGFPLPGDHEVLYSAVSSSGVIAYFSTPSSAEQVKALMLRRLRAGGWDLHVCRTTPGDAEPVTTIVVSTASSVASIQVGSTPEAAARLGGAPFSFFISIADTTTRPLTTAEPC